MDPTRTPALEDLHHAYHAALERCLAVEHKRPEAISARGPSTLDFLNRMSTNELLDLPPGHVRATVLTTAIGRSVDVIQVVRRDDGALLVAGHGKSEAVRAWLQRHIFFNDSIELAEPDLAFHRWGLYGPTAAEEAARLIGTPPPSGSQAVEAAEGVLWPTESPVPGFLLLARPALHERLTERWGNRGEGSPAREAYDAHRIERGLASPEDDLDQDTIPLEAGLWHLVSFSKGCYIGQEVIARMESRNRLARRLVGARLESLATPPQEVRRGESTVGRLTSTAVSPRHGPIGLGIARASLFDELPVDVQLRPSGVGATLVPLPFEPPPQN